MMPDVVILGGGPAGASTAIALAGAGRRVLLIDRSAANGVRVGEALPPAAKPLLSELGVLERVQGGEHLRCVGNVSCWGRATPSVHDFLRDPHGFGWHLDRPRFDESLRQAAVQVGAEVVSNVSSAKAERCGSGWRVLWRKAHGQQQESRCLWLVDATGRSSAVGRRLGVVRRRDDRLIAFVAPFRPAPEADCICDARTWIESAPEGWWYSAPVPSGIRMVAYHTDADLADRSALRRTEGFLACLARSECLHDRLRDWDYSISGCPRGVDASSARLDRVAGAGWLAVGDAAVSFDPLSSQGLFNALYTGLKGGRAIDATLDGDDRPLANYECRLGEVYRAYLQHRTAYYEAEGRWSERPFWRRRMATLSRPNAIHVAQ